MVLTKCEGHWVQVQLGTIPKISEDELRFPAGNEKWAPRDETKVVCFIKTVYWSKKSRPQAYVLQVLPSLKWDKVVLKLEVIHELIQSHCCMCYKFHLLAAGHFSFHHNNSLCFG